MDWEQPVEFASDEMVTSIDNFSPREPAGEPPRGPPPRLSNAPPEGGDWAKKERSAEDLEVEAEEPKSARISAIQREIIHKLSFNREELLRNHFGVEKPDAVLLKEVLDHFQQKKNEAAELPESPRRQNRQCLTARRADPAKQSIKNRPLLRQSEVNRSTQSRLLPAEAKPAALSKSFMTGDISRHKRKNSAAEERGSVRQPKKLPEPAKKSNFAPKKPEVPAEVAEQLALMRQQIERLSLEVSELRRENKGLQAQQRREAKPEGGFMLNIIKNPNKENDAKINC